MRVRSVLFALGAVLALAAGPVAAQAGEVEVEGPVMLNDRVSVEDDVVTLGDLFSGLAANADIPIARAPEPGRRVRLSAQWLARVAKAYRVDWRPRSLAVEATVHRASHTVGEEQITAAIVDALKRRGVDGDVAVTLDSSNISLRLPTSVPASVAVSNLSYDASNHRFSVNVQAPDADRPEASATLTGRVVRMVEVPVPARRIQRGEIVGKGDLEWVSMPARQMNRNHIVDAEEIVGKSARRPVRAGKPVRTTDVEKPRLVSKNGLVTLELRTARMQLTAKGRALDNGAKGEVVRVMNTNSNTTVTGVVVGTDTVSVQPQSTTLQSAQNQAN